MLRGVEDKSWLDLSSHRAWLEDGLATLMAFSLGSIRPGGGFSWLDADGSAIPGRTPQLFLTARMTYISARAVRLGVPGAGELLGHGVSSLRGLHADHVDGGWFTEPGAVTRKSTYDHVHVGLAAAAAVEAGHPDAPVLLDQVGEVVDTHLWDVTQEALRESFAPDWSDEEGYRGANANMHGLEAFLAMGHATGEPVWHERGLAIASRVVDGAARRHGWLLPEHFSSEWEEMLDYNRDEPQHPFRPFGATPGHALEWARFLLQLSASPLLGSSPAWLAEAADALTRRALDDLWAADGRPGLVYTVDWDGSPVAEVRLHWPVCEGIQTTALLSRSTRDPHWELWYRRLWDHAARYWIDASGLWRNELGADMQEAGDIWPGRPDVYHCGGAYIGPLSA